MSGKLSVWLDTKDNTQEGHIFTCALLFKGKKIWGRDALNKADDRFDLELKKKDRTLEGHTRYISVKSPVGVLYLDKLSTHENMEGLVTAINAVLAIEG